MGGKKKKEKKEASSRVDGAQGGSGTSLEAPQSSSQGPLKQEDDASGEVPAQYTLARVPGRDVGRELIEVNVSLPGIASENEVLLRVAERRLFLRVPGKFRLELDFDVPVRETPAMVKLFKRRALFVVELDIIPSVGSSARVLQADDRAATTSSANRGPPASTSSDPRFSDGPSAVLRGPVDLGPPPTRSHDLPAAADADPPTAAALASTSSAGGSGKAGALAAGLRRGFFNRGGGLGGSGASATSSPESSSSSLETASTGGAASIQPAGQAEEGAPAKKRYPELSPPVMSRVAVALSKVVEATRTEVNGGRQQQANSVLVDPAQRRAQAAKRAVRNIGSSSDRAAAEAHEAGMQALREGDAKRAVPLLGRAIALCPEEYAPLYEKIKEQVLLAGERMGQSAAEVEMRNLAAAGTNPLRVLLPAETSASASAKAAAELIIETATAQFEERRGPNAMESIMGAAAPQQGMGPQQPPPAGAAAAADGPAGSSAGVKAATAAPKAKAPGAAGGKGKAPGAPAARVGSVPLPADDPAESESTAAPAHPAGGSNGHAAAGEQAGQTEPKLEDGDGDDDALRVSWGEVAHALWHEWAAVLAEALPFVPELFGWERTEYLARRAVAPGSRSRPIVLGTITVLAAASVIAVTALVTFLARVALEWASRGLVGTGQAALALWDVVAWTPQWWAAIPACIFFAAQSRFAALRIFWGAPFWWWILGGGWWSAIGSGIVLFNSAFIGAGPFWLAVIAWPLLKASVRVSSRLWITIPLAVAVLVGWGLLFLIWLAATARLAHGAVGPLLDASVPDDATGEVARVLGCRDYFSVLEIELTADREAVRKAYRSKVLIVHPDKCMSPHAAAAFRRVNDANTTLSDDVQRADYIQQLVDFATAQRDKLAAETGSGVGNGSTMENGSPSKASGPAAAGATVRPRGGVTKKAGARRR